MIWLLRTAEVKMAFRMAKQDRILIKDIIPGTNYFNP